MDQTKQIAKGSNSSFYYAFNLLSAEKRNAMNTVYAFCRRTDDIIDEGNDSHELKYEKLRKWRIELEKAFEESHLPETPSGKAALNDLLVRIRKHCPEESC